MKVIVVTLDKSSRINPGTGECIEAFRPSVVTVTEFVKTLSMENKIDVIAKELPDSVTDLDFVKFYIESKRDTELAVTSFLAALKGNPTAELDNEKAAEKAADAAASAAAANPAAKAAAGAK
jgi:hypothetical protein